MTTLRSKNQKNGRPEKETFEKEQRRKGNKRKRTNIIGKTLKNDNSEK